MTDLQRAFNLLEENGFHVSRAYEENHKDAGNDMCSHQETTGALWFRIVPVENKDH
jgi:hypothetical protein